MDTISQVRPLNDRVLLEAMPEDKMSVGGIVFPDTLKRKPGYTLLSRVVDVGPKVKLCKPGQMVYAVWNCGVPVPAAFCPDGPERRLIKEEDIVLLDKG